ncbi:MAG: hypothetical protein US69_C0007G0039 [candidate division TM6 bacterium GW2011_GWF2_38_10]|nr:MAG: hypothetical protein US69_C0007G0039 [candidate division TM6 bacterium GW2011_GWF2_38_10]
MKYLRLSPLLLATTLAYTPVQLFTTPAPTPMTYQLPTQRLFQAVLNKDALAIEDLLKQGAYINAQNEDGDRPIDIAYTQGDFYLVSLLKNYGADVQKERIGKLPQEFKAPPISETFFEKSKLKQECIAILEDTQKAFDLFKRGRKTPKHYSDMDNEEKFYLDFEHATVQEKYPLVYLLLRKQVNALLAHKPMNKYIKLGIIFSPTEKNLIYHNAYADTFSNTIRFGWVYLYNYITNNYIPYTIWNTLAHEWQHLYQLAYSTEIEITDETLPIEKEIDADFLASKTSLLHIDDTATYEITKGHFITLIYVYLSSKTAHHPTLLIEGSNHILRAITDLNPYFLNNNLNFIRTALKTLIDKAHTDAPKRQSTREYYQSIVQFILNNYHKEIQKPYIQEQQDFKSDHPSDKARNENTLKVRCLYEILLLKKYYGTQASVTISPQNAPFLHTLITKDLAIAAIEDKSQNQPATDLPQQENSTPPLNPYHDFTYTIQLSDYSNTPILNPFIIKNNAVFGIVLPENFIIFALCNPQPHKVFSSTIIDARKKTSSLSNESNASDLPKKQIYPFNKNAFTVFEQLYNQSLSLTLQSTNPFLHHEKAIILFAQVAHILPELASHLVDAITKEKIAAALEYITITIFSIPEENNINNISLLSSRKKSEDIVNKVSLTLFAFFAGLDNSIKLTTITTEINKKLLIAADNLRFKTLIEKIFSIFFGTQQISLLEKLIEFKLKKTFYSYIKKGANVNTQNHQGDTPLHQAIKTNKKLFTQLLLKLKTINPDIANKDGEIPLHIAIKKKTGQPIIGMILAKTTNINAQNTYGNTPLHIAIILSQFDIIELLLNQNTINTDIANKDGETPLHIAIKKRMGQSIIDMILAKTTNFNIQDNQGNTPLYKAIDEKNIPTVQLLLQHNADPSIKNNAGKTPASRALEKDIDLNEIKEDQ